MGKRLRGGERVEGKLSLGCIFKISPRWRQVGNTALMLKGKIIVRRHRFGDNYCRDHCESHGAGCNYRGKESLLEKSKEKSPSRK